MTETFGRILGRELRVDRADAALAIVLRVAAHDGDLEVALRDLLHVCGRRRDVLEHARVRCAAMRPDPINTRALELLDGALRTPLYAPPPAELDAASASARPRK